MLDLIRILMLPLVPVYWLIIRIRNWFFDIGVFRSIAIDGLRVVSVGNLTVGGQGKTPLVIFLTKLLSREGMKPGVLSRGYGRRSKGFVMVADTGGLKADVDTSGDEIYQTALECAAPAAVCEKRVYGARQLQKKSGIASLVLDDSFQHRWIHRDADLLIFSERFLHAPHGLRRLMLPTGDMREPLSSLRRADAVILNRKFSERREMPNAFKRLTVNKKVFTASYRIVGFIDVTTAVSYGIEDFYGQKSLLVCGTANTYSFVNALKQVNIDTANRLFFKDHIDYDQEIVQEIRKQFYATNAYSVITTEKDAVKLTKFSRELDDIDIYYLKIELVFDQQEEFENFVLKKLTTKLNHDLPSGS